MEWEVVTSVWYKVDILGWRMSHFLLGWSGTTQNGLMRLGTMNKDLWITNFWKLQLWLDIGNWTLESSMDRGRYLSLDRAEGPGLATFCCFPAQIDSPHDFVPLSHPVDSPLLTLVCTHTDFLNTLQLLVWSIWWWFTNSTRTLNLSISWLLGFYNWNMSKTKYGFPPLKISTF